MLQPFGVESVVDEVESAVALSRLVLLATGARPSRVKAEIRRIRREFEPPTSE